MSILCNALVDEGDILARLPPGKGGSKCGIMYHWSCFSVHVLIRHIYSLFVTIFTARASKLQHKWRAQDIQMESYFGLENLTNSPTSQPLFTFHCQSGLFTDAPHLLHLLLLPWTPGARGGPVVDGIDGDSSLKLVLGCKTKVAIHH